MSINELPVEVLALIFKNIDLMALTINCTKVSQKWRETIAFLVILPILKKTNMGLAYKFMENGWSYKDPDLVLQIFDTQENLKKVQEQIMLRRIAYGTYTIRDKNQFYLSTQNMSHISLLEPLQTGF